MRAQSDEGGVGEAGGASLAVYIAGVDPLGCPPEITRELHTAVELGLSIFGAGAMLERVLVSVRRVKKGDTYQ